MMQKPQPRHRTIDSLGLSLHVLEWGEPSGQPLILVHGFLDQAQSWKFLVGEMLERSRKPLRIIAPDCRGHGDSGWVGAGGYYHFPDYVLDLDRVIETVQADSLYLVGHSMGGTISFLYSGAFPSKVDKLVLIEGVGPPGMSFSDAPSRMLHWLREVRERERGHFREYTSVKAGADQLCQTNPRLPKHFAEELAQTGMKQNANGKWVWKFDPLHRTSAPQPFYTEQALEFFRRIACPVMIVNGGESRHMRRSDKQERYAALRDHRIVTVENAGHMVHQDNPARLAELLLAFLGLA